MSQNEEQHFIKEKIKDKPSNKKKLIYRGLTTTGFAVLFGFVSCFVFYLMRPTMEKWFAPEPEDRFELPRDTLSDDTKAEDTVSQEENTQTDTDDNKEEKDGTTKPEKDQPDHTVYITEKQTLELKDYQVLQNKLYNIGRQANKFVVTVTGITESIDLFETPYESTGQTAGLIVGKKRKELLILTDHSVIEDVKEIQVTFINGDTVSAKLKKYDVNTGLAILSVSLEKISESTMDQVKVADLGNSLNLMQGTMVIAVGSPQGTNYTILTGNITSVANKVTTEDWNYTVLTTDVVASSSGNGALINIDGEVVGLIWQFDGLPKEEKTLTAVSVSELKHLIEMLSNGQDMPYIGIKGSTVTDAISEEYDIPKGVYIKEVTMDSPAMLAGLQNGDVIVAMDREPILTMDDYQEKLLTLAEDDEVSVTANRQGADGYIEYTCTVKVGTLTGE